MPESGVTPEVVQGNISKTTNVTEQEPTHVETPVSNTNQVHNNDNTFIEKERKVWPFVVLGLLLIIGGFFAYYYFIMTKPINVITKVFNNAYKNVEKGADGITTLDSSSLKTMNLDTTIAFTSDAEEYKEMSGIKATIKVGYDFNDSNNNIIDVDIKSKDSDLLNGAVTIADKKTYIDLKDKFSKVVYMESDESSINMDSLKIDSDKINSKKEEVLYLVNLVKNSVLDNITQEKLAKKIMLKDIDNKKVPVVEITYKIDYLEYKKLHNGVINAILADSKALEIVAYLDGSKTDEVKSKLEKEKDNLSEVDYKTIDVVLDIDAITNKLICLNIKDDESEINYKEKGAETNIQIKSVKDGTVDIIIDEKEKKVFVDANLIQEKEVMRFTLTIKVNEDTKTSAKYSVSFVMFDPKETSKEVFNLTGDMGIKLNESIKTVDVENAVNIQDLSKEEQQEFLEALNSSTALLNSFN